MYFGLNSTSLTEYFISCLACDKFCLPVEGGGLGIRKIGLLNKALLGKQLWQFGKEVNRLWHQVITNKYVEDKGGWYSRAVRGTHGYGMWKNIWAGAESFFRKVVYAAERVIVFDSSMILGMGILL